MAFLLFSQSLGGSEPAAYPETELHRDQNSPAGVLEASPGAGRTQLFQYEPGGANLGGNFQQ